MKYEIYMDRRARWRWRLKAANGRILADSGQGYTRRDNMLESLYLVRNSYLESPKICQVGR